MKLNMQMSASECSGGKFQVQYITSLWTSDVISLQLSFVICKMGKQ